MVDNYDRCDDNINSKLPIHCTYINDRYYGYNILRDVVDICYHRTCVYCTIAY